jgi:hypothetical protein
MRYLLLLVTVAQAYAAIDGTVTNGTKGGPQAGATVTLFQTTQQGPQNLGSVKSDAQGKFAFAQDVQPGVGGGPLLVQAVYGGVQYNFTITPGQPQSGFNIPVYESSKSPGEAKVDQHFFVLEPSADGTMQVTEGFLYKNDGKATWNDPDRGTLQFALPAAAQGKVEVNVRAPGGLPIRRAPDALGKPNQFKLDFPIKPGESQVVLSWTMPFQSPGVFEDHVLAPSRLIEVVAPPPIEIKGSDVTLMGQDPTTKANVYGVKGPDVKIQVSGTFSAQADSGGDSGQARLAENFPKLYGMLAANASFLDSVLAVKWVLLTIVGMLALGFTLLYRKGDPRENAGSAASLNVPASDSETATKASKHARGRG